MKNKKGFTLIELLICVLIIGILAGIGIGQYKKVVLKSRASKAITALRAITDAQKRYYLFNKHYTTDLTALDVEIQDDYYYFNCNACEGACCYARPKNGSKPFFEQSGSINMIRLFCRGTAKQCELFSQKSWGNSTDYWIIHE